MRWRSREKELAWLLAAALAVKAVVLVQLGGHPLLQPQGDLDTARYVQLARQIAAGGPLAIHEPFFLSPLYVYFLAAVFSVHDSLAAARIVQIVLGTAAVGFVYLLARQWFGVRVARLAAGLALLTGFLTFSEILILQSALDPFLVASALYAVSRTQATGGRTALVAAGVALGLFGLNRPNGLAYGIAAPVLIALASRRQRVGRAALVLASLLAVVGANALRNYLASGDAILISSHGGLNFYIGNNADATGIYHRVPGVSASMAGQVRDATRVAEAAQGRSLAPAEVSSYFYTRAWQWIASEPIPALTLFARKALLLVNRIDVPLNYSYAFYRRDEPTLLRVLVAGPIVLLPFGMVGLFLGARGAGLPYWTWASFVPIYGASVAVFFVADRYRLPLFIPLAVLAAHALAWLCDAVTRRQYRALVLPLAGLALAATVSARDLGLDDGRGGERSRKAVWLIEQGRYDEARRYAAAAAEGLAYPGVFHFQVGEALTAAGRYGDAMAELRAALAIDRGEPAIRLALGQALLLAGRSEEAVGHLKAAADAAFRPEVSGPWLVRALAAAGERAEAVLALASLSDAVVDAASAATALEIGSLGLELQAPVPSERWLRSAVARHPGSAEAHEKLAVALVLQRRPHEALASIERACRLAPASASARLNLAVVYAQLGRVREARAAAREAMRLDPSEPRAAALLRALPRDSR
ncbi:MAG: tetratricopeptide repeat protein [Acidobacteria bacterium]|nr:tetratricopeptide repeat protein [Acidobacteriota bacterium]